MRVKSENRQKCMMKRQSDTFFDCCLPYIDIFFALATTIFV